MSDDVPAAAIPMATAVPIATAQVAPDSESMAREIDTTGLPELVKDQPKTYTMSACIHIVKIAVKERLAPPAGAADKIAYESTTQVYCCGVCPCQSITSKSEYDVSGLTFTNSD